MSVEIIIIGDEILYGIVKDENSYILVNELTARGFFVNRITIVRDDEREIIDAVKSSLNKGAKIIITTGGLGPTEDDKTIDAMSKFFGRKIIIDEEMAKRIKDCFDGNPPEVAYKMARVLEGAKIYRSPLGLAPAQVIRHEGVYIIVLPGPPKEVKILIGRILDDISNILGKKYRCRRRIYLKAKEAELAHLLTNAINRFKVYIKALVAEKSEHGLPIEILGFGEDKEECKRRLEEVIKFLLNQNVTH